MPALDLKPMPLVSEITTLKAVGAIEVASLPFEWLSFGAALGIGGVFLLGLFFGYSTLKRSVWVSQLLFVMSALGSLSWIFFGAEAYPKVHPQAFAFLFRLEIVLATIATFNLVRPTNAKQNLGFFYSGFLGAFFGVSVLSVLWPVEGILFAAEIFLIVTSLYLGARFLLRIGQEKFGERTLFFQLITVLLVAFTYFWVPDAAKFSDTSTFIFAFLTTAMLISSSATVFSSAKERTQLLITRLQKELFVMERRFAKQSQVIASLQNDAQNLSEQLQNEVRLHRLDSIRDHLRIRSLEESSQDIAHGLIVQLRELQSDNLFIIAESKSPKYRLSFIKAYAERTHLLARRLQNMATYLLSTEAALDTSSECDVVVNAGDILKECLYLCNPKLKRMCIEIEIQSMDNNLIVKGRPALLAQGFLGLIYNALEATETSDVRRVTLVLRRIEENDQAWVEFGISNSGPGIPTAIKARAFHAKQRDGLGFHSLGLSMAFGIFEHAGGSLNLDTDAVATTLLARLPLVQNTEESSLRLVI